MVDFGSISQHLLESSPDALIVVDSAGIIRFANRTAGTVFGYGSAELVGQPMELLIPARFRIRHGAHVAGYVRSPINREMGARLSELFARRADGSEFPAAIRLAPFRSGDSDFVAAAIRDVTERSLMVDELVAAREEADRANRAKSRFLATASHDLRQPLQTIRLLNASMLRLTAGEPKLHDALRSQELAIDGATRLLNALLDISRLESGAIEPQLSPVALAGVFADLAREFDTVAAQKQLSLHFEPTQALLSTDRTLFNQLLQNLIGNALKYTDHGHVRVSHAIDSEALTLSIEDSGIGVPEDKLDRIFDEYYQVGPHGTQRLGVGLGLAIVREVSRLLGYSISVSSRVGVGTRVRVRIPRGQLLSETPVPGPGAAVPLPPPAQARCRVILLEDNDAVRMATELFLTLEGHETRSAATVAEAEGLLSDMRPGDVLIADYHLEGSDGLTGLDVMRQLRSQLGREVPTILLSGDLPSLLRVVKSPVPNSRFLSKPVDARALLGALDELCRA